MDKEFHTVRGYQLLEQNQQHLTSAMEDYLEMIYRNSIQDGYLRISRLAELLHVKTPSASRMVQRLNELGLLNYKKYDIIILNEYGKQIGAYLLERHIMIEHFLSILGCKDDLLRETELIEHSVSAEMLKCIKVFCSFFLEHEDILEKYKAYMNARQNLEIVMKEVPGDIGNFPFS